ncbi:MAG: type II toxin-antitoxin system HicA family toxin [Gammaproteobacteria bacterium]|nr:type II toxin-antitoxin system HicA family toxin [Gammaproteobacteria bacterium]
MAEGHYRAVTDELSRLGFRRVRGGKGSHEKWRLEGAMVLTVPRHLKSRHTANAILRDAGSQKTALNAGEVGPAPNARECSLNRRLRVRCGNGPDGSVGRRRAGRGDVRRDSL